jgi:hypothetical protein
LKGCLKCKGQGNAGKEHLESMEDANKGPYKTKGYTQNNRTQNPKQALKVINLKKKLSCHFKNTTMIASSIIRKVQQ